MLSLYVMPRKTNIAFLWRYDDFVAILPAGLVAYIGKFSSTRETISLSFVVST